MKTALLSFFITIFSLVSIAVVVPTSAAALNLFGEACSNGNSQSSEVCKTQPTDPITGSNGIIVAALNILSFVTAVAAVIAIIIAGYEYMISAGDSNKINRAKNALLAAVIGVGVVLVAQTVVAFIVNLVK